MRVAPISIHLLSFPYEYWALGTLQYIVNTLREFVKVAKHTKHERYIAFARIYVYMDLSKELPEKVSLN